MYAGADKSVWKTAFAQVEAEVGLRLTAETSAFRAGVTSDKRVSYQSGLVNPEGRMRCL